MADEQGAWLEEADGKRLPIQGNASIGRSPKNSLILASPKISRRYAIINAQNVREFWVIDLASSTGTFLNKRRVHQPMRLCDRDQFIIGDYLFTFGQRIEVSGEDKTTFVERTIREIKNVSCWPRVANIENFTPLNRSLREPRFRLALHFGLVSIGGLPSMGEESLMGKDVNFVFRMEKLAGSLKISLLTSMAGRDKLGSLITAEPACADELKGFEGKYEFFSC